MLKEHGFDLKTALPRQIPRLALLNVSRLVQDDAYWVSAFLGAQEVWSQRQEDRTVYTTGQETLTIFANGHVFYTNNLPGIDEANTRVLAERYLRDWKLWQNNMKLDLACRGDSMVFVIVCRDISRISALFSAIEVYLTDGRPREVHIYQVQPHGFSDKETAVISAQKAVQTFIKEAAAVSSKSIIDISLGYYSLSYDAERWESAPVWRIATQDGGESYINAFTGEVEKTTF